jgi:hypothetical protein
MDMATSQMRAIVRPAAGDLVITEFMADPSGTDTNKEWFEILANRTFDLNGLVLANEGTTHATVSSATCLSLQSGAYAVFAQSTDPMANGGLPAPAALFTFTLANSGARSISVLLPDAGVLDVLAYSSATSGASTQLSAGLTSPLDGEADAGNLCATPAANHYGTLPDGGVGDRGTPGAANVACP